MKIVVPFTLLASAVLTWLVFSQKPTPTYSGPRRPVLVELFTSEGCSSCPPADEFLVELKSKQPVENVQVIAIGYHVDYWNYIGWTDRFSSAQFTRRQQQYADRLNGDPYTPELVVNGTSALVGSDRGAARRAI